MVSYGTAMEAIAIEANIVANATQLAQQYFPSVVKQFNSLVSAITYETKVDKKEFTKSQNAILTYVLRSDPDEIAKLLIGVPEGYNNNLLETFKVVETSLDTINKELLGYITEYRKYLASFITNKDSKKSLVDLTGISKKTANSTQRLVNDIAGLFNTGSGDARLPFGDVFADKKEVAEVFKQYQKLNPSFKALDIKKLKDEIQDISELLESAIKQIDAANFELLSPEVLKSLSEGSYAVAKSAEAIAIVYFKMIAIFNIVPNLENTINEEIKK